MGRVEFKTGTFRIPHTAKTGDPVRCSIEAKNIDPWPFTFVHAKHVWKISSDPEGRRIIGVGESEFDAYTYTQYELYATFIMPAIDIWVAVELWQLVDDTWLLMASTAYIPIDNPDYTPPAWWQKQLYGLKLYEWAIIGLIPIGALAVGTIIGKSSSRS